jgi:hypothetical protein
MAIEQSVLLRDVRGSHDNVLDREMMPGGSGIGALPGPDGERRL